MLVSLLLVACQPSEVPEPPAVAAAPVERAQSPAFQSGIEVHGSWVIEVRDPDGTLVNRVAFENSYPDGDDALPQILAGEKSAGTWSVLLANTTLTSSPCEDTGGEGFYCVLTEAGTTGWDTSHGSDNQSKNLTVASSTKSVQLTGSINATRDGTVNLVSTRLGTCDPSVAPDACTDIGSFDFTNKDLSGSPVSVVTGQQIMATVTLDFSSAP